MSGNFMRNGSGCYDPTAWTAITHVMSEERKKKRKKATEEQR